jgi:hypothetical protein
MRRQVAVIEQFRGLEFRFVAPVQHVNSHQAQRKKERKKDSVQSLGGPR